MIAFALREDHAGTVTVDGAEVPLFTGGSVTYADGRTFDLREALDAGDGTIVVADGYHELVLALRGSPALKEVPAPTDAKPLNAYDPQPLADLRAEASRRGLAGAGNARKAAVVKALLAHDELIQHGDPAGAASPADPIDVDELGDDPDPDADADGGTSKDDGEGSA